MEGCMDHDFHYSRLIIDWNSDARTWQGILRVFTDDLEMALNEAREDDMPWRLGDQREYELADEAIFAYAKSHWRLYSKDSRESNELEWNYIGKEVDFDLTFIYLESSSTHPDSLGALASDGLFELFDDQVNEVTVQRGDSSIRAWLTQEDPTKTIQF